MDCNIPKVLIVGGSCGFGKSASIQKLVENEILEDELTKFEEPTESATFNEPKIKYTASGKRKRR